MDDGEEVLAQEAPAHRSRVGAGHGGVVGGDEQGADPGAPEVKEGIPEPVVVDEAALGRPGRRAAESRVVPPELGHGEEEGAASRPRIGAGHPGQQGDGPHGLAAVCSTRHAGPEPDVGRTGAAVLVGESLDVGRGEPRDLGDPRGSEAGEYLVREPLEAHRLAGEVVAVREPVASEDVHQAEREGGVGADAEGKVPVRLGRRPAPPRIDGDERHARLPPRLDRRPEVDVRRHEIGAPRDQEVGVRDGLGVGASDGTQRRRPPGVGRGVAHGAGDQPRGPEDMEQRHGEPAVDLTLVRAVAVPEDGERSVGADDRLPTLHELVERRVPGDGGESPLALRADPPQRRPQPLGRVHPLGLAAHLGAEEAGRDGVVGIPLDADEAVVLDVGQDRAHVGAVVGTDGADDPCDSGH